MIRIECQVISCKMLRFLYEILPMIDTQYVYKFHKKKNWHLKSLQNMITILLERVTCFDKPTN